MSKLYMFFIFLISLVTTPIFAKDSTPIEKLINSERVTRQLGPLSFDEKLQCAAKVHAMDIGKSGLCTHIGKDQSNMKQRLKRCKYDVSIADELLACKFSTPEGALQAWLDSPKQKLILTDTKYTTIGCAEVKNYYVCIVAK